ncbi:hypothetical protein V2I01_37885 [Micromonospora sp. BRA006-A]|nr:hypothetical protein [Micromonospora sp. BRA006-A]
MSCAATPTTRSWWSVTPGRSATSPACRSTCPTTWQASPRAARRDRQLHRGRRGQPPTVERLTEALARGLIEPSHVDRAVRRILSVRSRLGDLAPDPHDDVPPDTLDSLAHRELAREAARQSVVLLRNDGLLPLRPGTRVAVLGPLADTVLTDWYSGTRRMRSARTPGCSGGCPR